MSDKQHELFGPGPSDEWRCTMDNPKGGPCGELAVVGCDGMGDGCLVGGDAWCKKHDPRETAAATGTARPKEKADVLRR